MEAPPYAQTVDASPAGPEIPTSVAEAFDAKAEVYTYTFQLSKVQHDAILAFGLNPLVEVDSHVIRRADAIIEALCQAYVTDCFSKGILVDCTCRKKILQKYLEWKQL